MNGFITDGKNNFLRLRLFSAALGGWLCIGHSTKKRKVVNEKRSNRQTNVVLRQFVGNNGVIT